MTKPSIVFAHSIWADGSCFQKLIPTLRAEGHEVMAAQYGLDTLKGDVDATIRVVCSLCRGLPYRTLLCCGQRVAVQPTAWRRGTVRVRPGLSRNVTV